MKHTQSYEADSGANWSRGNNNDDDNGYRKQSTYQETSYGMRGGDRGDRGGRGFRGDRGSNSGFQ